MRRPRNDFEERRLEQLFARLRRRTPAPAEHELRALARAAAAEPRPPATPAARRRLRLRWAVVLAAVALLVGSGLGFSLGSSVTPSGSARSSFVGLGFLPARGWTVVQSGTFDATGKASATAANVALDPRDDLHGVPVTTVESLPASGVLIHATFATRGDPALDVAFPVRTLPLQMSTATRVSDAHYRLRAGVGGYNVDTRVYFGAPDPSAARVGQAQGQLNRLVVASERVTIFARPSILPWGVPLTLFGSVDNGRADEVVDIQARECGSSSRFFRGVMGVRTGEGGAWTTTAFPRGTTTYRAVWNDVASAQVTVRRRANVSLQPAASQGKTLRVGVSGRSFWRKKVLLQRFDRVLGTWKTIRTVVLTKQETFPSVSGFVTPGVPKGTRLRAVVPLSQARPCYLAGISKTWTV